MVKPIRKNILVSPLEFQWPECSRSAQAKLMDRIAEICSANNIKRPSSIKRPVTSRKRKRSKEADIQESPTPASEPAETAQSSAPSKSLAQQCPELLIGYSAILRVLQKPPNSVAESNKADTTPEKKLRLVLLDSRFVKHLAIYHFTGSLLLQENRGCPGAKIEGLSARLAPVLALQSVMALGFLDVEGDTIFGDLVNYALQNLQFVKRAAKHSSVSTQSVTPGSFMESPYVPASVVSPILSKKKRKKNENGKD